MNRTIAALLITFTSIACLAWTFARPARKAPKYEVSGTVMIKHDYCGGARPSEEQMDSKPYPVKGTVLYIRQANSSDAKRFIDSVVTDSAGNFKVKLTTGNYCLVEKWKTEPFVLPVDSRNETWDTACYRQQYNQCDYSLNVKKKTSDVKIVLQRHCAWTRPCCAYHGPMPPSAPPVNRGGNQPGHQE